MITAVSGRRSSLDESSRVESVLGIPIRNDLTKSSFPDVFERLVEEGRQRRESHYVATVNFDFLVRAGGLGWTRPSHRRLREALLRSSLNVPDGFPLVWMSRWLGGRIAARVTGASVGPGILQRCHENRWGVYFLGPRRETLERLARVLDERWPGIRVCGMASPQLDLRRRRREDTRSSGEVVAEIRRTHPEVLILSLGCPKQELWFQEHRDRVEVPVAIGLGSTLEYVAGTKTRAPKRWRELNLEWLWRLSREPARLGPRVLFDTLWLPWAFFFFAGTVFASRALWRLSGRPAAKAPTVHQSPSCSEIRLPPYPEPRSLEAALSRHGHGDEVVVSFDRVRRLDVDAMGALIAAVVGARRRGAAVRLRSATVAGGCLLAGSRLAWLDQDRLAPSAATEERPPPESLAGAGRVES
jgi:exopolysaccharide biosynthesis WecB/TagA/CpsF family protein